MARRLAGWGLGLIWSLTGLLQAAAPVCGHHTVAPDPAAVEAPAHDAVAHLVHESHADASATHATHGEVTPHHASAAHTSHHHGASPASDAPTAPAPCDCVGTCCTAVAAPLPDLTLATASAAVLPAVLAVSRDVVAPIAASRDHRQPPATAPPGSRDA